MGYTHYWSFKKAPRGQAQAIETAYQKGLIDCQKIILYYSNKYGGLSGYSAHCKLGQYGGLNINGSRDDAHETFVMREHFSQNEDFNFCKTARKPYDQVVTACLIAMQNRLGACFEASSDGDASDWADGLELAQKVLKLKKLRIPSGVSNRDNDSGIESA